MVYSSTMDLPCREYADSQHWLGMTITEKASPKGTAFRSNESTMGASHRHTYVNQSNRHALKTQTKTTVLVEACRVESPVLTTWSIFLIVLFLSRENNFLGTETMGSQWGLNLARLKASKAVLMAELMFILLQFSNHPWLIQMTVRSQRFWYLSA